MFDPDRFIQVKIMDEIHSCHDPDRTRYHLNVKDVRRFIEWTEKHCPDVEIVARYQRMEHVERTEANHSQFAKGRVIINDFLDIIATPNQFMLFKLSLPCGITYARA